MFKERDKIQKLITDTIVTLCNSGLTFDTELCVEGLLGITLDHKDILLVNINKIIKTQQNGSHGECRSLDKELVVVASRTSSPSRSLPTFDDYPDGNYVASTREDEEGSKDNDSFECHPEPESADLDDIVDSERESYERIHPARDSTEGDYRDHDNDHMIVIKEEPDDYIDCEQQAHMSATALRHTTAVFPEHAHGTFSHMSSSEMPPSNNRPVSYTPITNNVNLDTMSSLYCDHLKDEHADETLNPTNNEAVNSWFNTLTEGHFEVSGSSPMSIPNPQQRLWAPKQSASNGMLHIPNADQISKQHLIKVTNAHVRKHRCPQCSFTSDKSFNLQRHINKKHTGHPGMPLAQIGVGTATNAATATAPVVTTDTKTALKIVAPVLASDIEVVPSLASSQSTSLASVSIFKCLHCAFTSKKKFNVKRHIRQQHDQQVVTCERCNRRCRNQYYLNLYHKPKCPYTQLKTTV